MKQAGLKSYLVVMHSTSIGGMEIHTAQWIRLMAAAGHPVTLLETGPVSMADKLQGTAIRQVHRPIDRHLSQRQEYAVLSKLVAEHRADVTVFSRNGFSVVVLLAMRRHSRRLLTIDHGIPGMLKLLDPNWQPPSWIKARLASLAVSRTLAVSEAVRQSLIDVWHASPSKVITCHNWVDTARHHPDAHARRAHRQAHGLKPEEYVIGTIGRLGSDKRIVELARGYHHFCQQYTGPSRLVVIGRGSDRPRVEAVVKEHGLESQAMFIDWTDDPAAWHRSFDVEVNLCLTEAFGLSAVEAMACGGLLLAQSGSALDEYVEHGKNGLRVDMSTPQDIGRWLHHAATLPADQRETMTLAAKQTAVDRFSPQVALAYLLENLGSPQAASLARQHGLEV